MAKRLSNVDYVFAFMASKYQSWWRKRVATDDLLAAERLAFEKVLDGVERARIDAAFKVLLKKRADSKLSPPPSAEQFAALLASAVVVPKRQLRGVRCTVSAADALRDIRRCLV
jgi:hypothetical protein